jgi:hypothetical protein
MSLEDGNGSSMTGPGAVEARTVNDDAGEEPPTAGACRSLPTEDPHAGYAIFSNVGSALRGINTVDGW